MLVAYLGGELSGTAVQELLKSPAKRSHMMFVGAVLISAQGGSVREGNAPRLRCVHARIFQQCYLMPI